MVESTVPQSIRLTSPIQLDKPLSETEVIALKLFPFVPLIIILNIEQIAGFEQS